MKIGLRDTGLFSAVLICALGWGMANPGLAGETKSGDLTVWADYVCYRVADDPAMTEVEFIFAFQRHEFTFAPRPGGIIAADVGLWVQILDLQDRALTDTVAAYFGYAVRDSAEAARPNHKVFYALPLQLSPGSYHAKIIVLDGNSDEANRKVSELIVPLLVRDFSSPDLSISDLKLAYDIDIIEEEVDSGGVDVLERSNHKVYPDPRGVLSRNRPRLYFYGEIYNLQYEPGGENVYELGFRFLKEGNITVKDFGKRAYKKPGRSSVLATSLKTRDLPEGQFLLEVTVSDSVAGTQAVITKPFTIMLETPADSLTPEEAKKMREVILYLARREELKMYDQLSLAGKRSFIREFWRRFDRTPRTPHNEFKEEYYRRFNYANEEYSTTFGGEGNGWKTDRGRVYILYGLPDETERYPSSMSEKPWEEWFYFQLADQGEVYFIFEDDDGLGNLKLVHSTARGEKRDPFWEERLREKRMER